MTAADAEMETEPDAAGAARPAPWRGLARAFAAAAAACGVLITWADVPVALFFRGLRDTAFVDFFAAITDFANGVIWYSVAVTGFLVSTARSGAGAAVIAAPRRWTRAMRAWSFMICAMLSSLATTALLKLLIGRMRPRVLFDEGATGFAPLQLLMKECSFPSGHTQSITGAMVALSFIYPKGRPLFLGVAAMIGASRFITSVHFLSDVVAGAFVAAAWAVIWRWRYERGGVPVALGGFRAPSPS